MKAKKVYSMLIVIAFLILCLAKLGIAQVDQIVLGNVAYPEKYTLTVTKSGSGTGTVTSSPAGIDCGSTCSSTFPSDSTVTLTETPDLGSIFVEWSGDATGTDSTVQVVMDSNKTVNAEFEKPIYIYTVESNIGDAGSGTGIQKFTRINISNLTRSDYLTGLNVQLGYDLGADIKFIPADSNYGPSILFASLNYNASTGNLDWVMKRKLISDWLSSSQIWSVTYAFSGSHDYGRYPILAVEPTYTYFYIAVSNGRILAVATNWTLQKRRLSDGGLEWSITVDRYGTGTEDVFGLAAGSNYVFTSSAAYPATYQIGYLDARSPVDGSVIGTRTENFDNNKDSVGRALCVDSNQNIYDAIKVHASLVVRVRKSTFTGSSFSTVWTTDISNSLNAMYPFSIKCSDPDYIYLGTGEEDVKRIIKISKSNGSIIYNSAIDHHGGGARETFFDITENYGGLIFGIGYSNFLGGEKAASEVEVVQESDGSSLGTNYFESDTSRSFYGICTDIGN